jgi:serine/threonine protein kinase
VCDFSFAEWIQNPTGMRRTSSHGIKKVKNNLDVDAQLALKKNTTTLVGTGGCISPETEKSCKATEATDVFSLGVLLYEMVTGRKAFPTHSSQIHYPSWLRQFDEGALVDLIKGCIHEDASQRFNIEEVLENDWLHRRAEDYASASL